MQSGFLTCTELFGEQFYFFVCSISGDSVHSQLLLSPLHDGSYSVEGTHRIRVLTFFKQNHTDALSSVSYWTGSAKNVTCCFLISIRNELLPFRLKTAALYGSLFDWWKFLLLQCALFPPNSPLSPCDFC